MLHFKKIVYLNNICVFDQLAGIVLRPLGVVLQRPRQPQCGQKHSLRNEINYQTTMFIVYIKITKQ